MSTVARFVLHNPNTFTHRYAEQAPKLQQAALVRFLEQNGEATVTELCSALGCSERTLRRHAQRAVKEGLARTVYAIKGREGGYRTVEPPQPSQSAAA